MLLFKTRGEKTLNAFSGPVITKMETFFFNKMVKHHLWTIVNKSLRFSGGEGIMQHFPAQPWPG